MLIGRCRAWIEDDPQLRPRRGARRGGMRSAGKGDEDKWRAGLSGENYNVLGPKNPGFTVFWTAGRAIAHEAEKQGVGRGEQCARASGQELTLNRQGAQGAHCAVRLRGAHWSVRGHRRPALRSARAHFERARGDKQRGSARRLCARTWEAARRPQTIYSIGMRKPSAARPRLRLPCLSRFAPSFAIARLRSFEKSFEKPLPLHIPSLTNAPRPTRH